MAPPGRKTTNITERELDAEFEADLEKLKKFIRTGTKPITLNDKALNGPELADFIAQAVSRVNEGTPLLVSVVQSLARNHNQQMISECADTYTDAIGQLGMIESLQMFQRAHAKAVLSTRKKLQMVRKNRSTFLVLGLHV